MPSTIIVRHVCDRCGEHDERVDPPRSTSLMPEGWRLLPMNNDGSALLCHKCAFDLIAWAHGKLDEELPHEHGS